MHPRRQGDIGEASAIAWLTNIGAIVSKPLFHSPDYDLIAEMEGTLVRVEVKTSGRQNERGRWEVRICTQGGNQSWNGLTKRFEPTRCDYLFVLVADGRRWFIPAARIEATLEIKLGARKYGEFEIEPGAPFPPRTRIEGASTIAPR